MPAVQEYSLGVVHDRRARISCWPLSTTMSKRERKGLRRPEGGDRSSHHHEEDVKESLREIQDD
jgi:hypothetical protein